MVKSTPLRRDWSSANRKRTNCRVCGAWPTELAHTIARAKQDVEAIGPKGGAYLYVHPDSVVSLCQEHHQAFDARRLDLLPYLTIDEQVNAVEAAGGVELARKRLTGGAA